ncbi:MAG: hypothetical protein KF789_06710 [Bdellovibrionaceae bacterium]|nr:hypothetical protein [Pseudobdellovibrionaceae bacterium]
MSPIKYWLAYAKAVILQAYYDLAELDGLPFQLITQDYEDKRKTAPRPRRVMTEKNPKFTWGSSDNKEL